MATDIRLVPAKPDDVHFFVALNELSYQSLIERQFGVWNSREQAMAFLDKWNPAAFRKVLVDGEAAGGIWVDRHRDWHELREIQVLPAYRNRGIGTALIRREIEAARGARKPLRLRVLLHNPAFNLYRRLGFEVVATDDVRRYMEIT